jgi:hypothetical protein
VRHISDEEHIMRMFLHVKVLFIGDGAMRAVSGG